MTQAASGMEFLARAGFEVSEIMDAMPGLLDLAASANMDLGRAADIVSNIISGFGYNASESARVADVLAKASSSANTDVGQLGQAMEVVAPIANTLGLEIEDLSAAVGFMSDAGIQGSQAGRQLRQGMLRLASPTGAASDLIEDLGIKVFDADGNMKDMASVVEELGNGLEGMSADARTAALATIFGSESTAGWSALLDRGANDLANYTRELQESEGAARTMAEIMEDNAKGSMREFRSALEGAGIAISQHIIPQFTRAIEFGTGLVRKFGELDEETQRLIVSAAGVAAAVGPVLVVGGQLAMGIGGLMTGASALTGVLAGAGGLTAAFTALTGPVGLTVGAIGLAGAGIYAYTQYANRAKEVNLDTANSYLNQANSLEEIAGRYDELRRISGLSADEIGRVLDLQSRLEGESDPKKIEALQQEYEKLRKKSGLSNEQLEEMLELNNQIIRQTPEVQQTFTERGNSVVEATDKVYDYIQSLRNMAWEELQIERLKALENEAEVQEEINRLSEELARHERNRNELLGMSNMTQEEISQRLDEINKKFMQGLLSEEELNELSRERGHLYTLQEGKLTEQLDKITKQREEVNEDLELNRQKLSKLYEVDAAIAGILLLELGINEQGREGLRIADEQLKKLRDEKAETQERIKQEGDKGGLLQDHIRILDEQINRHQSIIGQIERETGLTSELLDDERERERVQGQIERRLNTTARLLTENTREAGFLTLELGKDVTKNVRVTDNGTIDDLNKRASAPVNKSVHIHERIAASAGLQIPKYAAGTECNPNALEMVG
ncbi:TP901 family phage tail tape measure protein [Evansella vedderi]|uniref:TP901 family phage tail tape measure protein n=1 Tax=Evansella vedderi TaxID=38282 RepID=A0ABU0A371_9BACI|nr:phage tail tape measure protein [Evansella vedderi]MDQ0257939.1 TP901 family phage tail tape measure protein [Evansella vedderi]